MTSEGSARREPLAQSEASKDSRPAAQASQATDPLAKARKAPRRKGRIPLFEDSQSVTRKILTPLKAIRAKCLDCNYSSVEVQRCPCEDCALWPYRFGHRPREADLVVFDSMTQDKKLLGDL